MGKNTKVLWAIILWLATLEAFGQSISILFDKEIYTCEATTIQVNINNNTSNELPAGELILKLPCQSRYIIGSILNATEANLNNLNSPILKTGIIGAGKTLNVTIKLLLGCESLACLDNQNKFDLSASYTVAGKTTSETSLPFNVSAGFVTFTKIDFAFMPIEAGTTQTRKITFKNSKRGRVSSCTFVDKYEDVMNIKSLSSAVVSNVNNSLVLRFDSTDFKLIGNKDIYFDHDEQIIVEELVTFKNCSLEHANSVSSLTVQWGCNNTTCQVSQAYASTRLIPISDYGNKFSINAISSDPLCLDPATSMQRLEIREQSHMHTLTNINLTIKQIDNSYILMKSFTKPSFAEVRFDSIKVNECGDSVAKIAYITAPDFVPLSDPLRIHAFTWKAVNCDSLTELCNQLRTRWSFDYAYNKSCAVSKDNFYKGKGITPSVESPIIFTSVLLENPKIPVEDGDKPKIKTLIIGDKLLLNGSVDIIITFPNLLMVLPTDYKLMGKTPFNIKEVIVDTLTTLTLSYTLPFDTTTLALYIPTMVDCSKYKGGKSPFTEYNTGCDLCLSDKPGIIHSISVTVTFDFGVPCSDKGKIKACNSIGFSSTCATYDITKKDIPIYFDYYFELGRINYGLPDNNRDGLPDVIGTIDTTKIDKGEIMWNDTLKIVAKGKIVADIAGSSFSDLLVSLFADKFSSSNGFNKDFLTDLLFNKGGWRDLPTKLYIYDKSTNKSYDIIGLTDTIKDNRIVYDLSASHLNKLNPLIPKGFRYEDGDSIYLESKVVIDLEIYKAYDSLHAFSQLLKFFVFTNAYYGDNLTTFQTPAVICNCYETGISLSGYNQKYSSSFTNIYNEKNICTGAQYRNLFQVVSAGHTLITPSEIRPSARLKGVKFGAIPNYAIDTLIIFYRLMEYLTTPPSIVTDEQTYFDIKNLPQGHPTLLNSLSDHLIVLSRRLTGDCASRTPTESIPYTIYFETNDISGLIIADSIKGIMNSEFKLPYIKQDITQKKITTFNNKVATQLQYTLDLNKSNYRHDVDGLFVRVRHSSAINSVRVYDPVTGAPFPNEYGIYQIGTLKNSKFRKVEFDAKSTSCGKEIIYFDYGYDCGIYRDPARTPCFIETDSIEVTFPNSIIDMDTDDTPMSIELCTEIDQKITISNAGLGTAYDITVDAELPEGLTLITGSSKIQYPDAQGSIVNLPNPVLVQGNSYRWVIKNGWPLHQLQGLSGTNFAPNNKFNLIYKVKTSCDYAVGKSIVYRSSAQQLCGETTNISLKVANNIKISNVTPPYNIDIKSNHLLKPNCELDTLVLQYSFAKPSTLLNIQLAYPQGYKYLSHGGNLSNNSVLDNNNTLKWSSTTEDDSVQLDVVFVKKGVAFCDSDLFKLSTSLSTPSSCKGEDCEVQVLTGENITTIPARNKSIDIPLWAVEMLADGRLKYKLGLTRDFSGSTPIFIRILVDVDKNGIISVGDTRLDSFELIMHSASKTFELSSTVINGNTLDLCQIIVWMQGSENCICNDKIQVGTLKPLVNTLPIVLCSGQSKTIGLPTSVPGTFYQWNTELGLSCTQCPQASFSVSNTTQGPFFFQRILTETKTDGCAIDYIFNITVNPQPSILNGDVSACQGDTIKLISTVAQSYAWTGPNILQNGQQIMVAAPTTNSTYTLAITDINGCTGTSQINVILNNAPSGSVIYDSLFCSGVLPTLQLIIPDSVTFDWILGKNHINNPNSLNPTVLQLTGNTNLIVQVRKGDCFKNINIPIAFKPPVIIEGLNDSIYICRNSPLEITLSGAQNYKISPPTLVTCLNANCSKFTIKTDFLTQTFVIESTDTDGCIGSQTMVVNTKSSIMTEKDLSICLGDTIIWQGIELYSEGRYCDTLLASECTEIRCLNLRFKQIVTTYDKLSICQGDSIKINQSYIKTAGMYCDTVVSTSGCKEISCIDLSIRVPINLDEEIVICADSSALIFGQLITKAGTYCRPMAGSGDQCDTMRCITLKLESLPDLSNLIIKYEVEQGQTIKLEGPPGYTTYTWMPPTGLSCSNCPITTATANTNISYTLEVTNELGCRSRKDVDIAVTEICFSLLDRLPNAFTPNGDNINDLYTIPDADDCGPKHIIVYNRWGNIVYEDPEWDNRWNGFSSNGRLLPQGTYYILLKFINTNLSSKTMVDLRLE